MSSEERIKLNDRVTLYDAFKEKEIKCTVVSVTNDHVILRQPDGKLWCITKKQFLEMRRHYKANEF